MPLFKKLLMTMMVLGTVSMTVGAGTFASFTAGTTNVASTFQNGSIILGQNKGQTPAGDGSDNPANFCLSTGTAAGGTVTTNTADCGQLFNLLLQKPGSNIIAPGSQLNMTVQNFGNLPGLLKLHAVSACSGTLDCAAVQMKVQEYTDVNRTTEKANGCVFGGNQGGTTCTWSDSFTLGVFDNAETSAGAMDAFGGAASIRYFRISLRLRTPDGLAAINATTNTFQSKTLTVNMGWRLDQT